MRQRTASCEHRSHRAGAGAHRGRTDAGLWSAASQGAGGAGPSAPPHHAAYLSGATRAGTSSPARGGVTARAETATPGKKFCFCPSPFTGRRRTRPRLLVSVRGHPRPVGVGRRGRGLYFCFADKCLNSLNSWQYAARECIRDGQTSGILFSVNSLSLSLSLPS